MMLLAAIATGETGAADVCFLIAVVVAVVAALWMSRPGPLSDRVGGPLVAAAVGFVALGLLLL